MSAAPSPTSSRRTRRHDDLAKAATTPADPTIGVIEGPRRAGATPGLDAARLLARTRAHRPRHHGRHQCAAGAQGREGRLLTTEGHRDVIEMREGLKPERYNLRMPPPEPLVPRHLRSACVSASRADGAVRRPLDPARSTPPSRRWAEGVEAVAICFLHAWRNPAHEQAAAEAVRAALPDVFVTSSADVYPQIKEYERFSTTVVNAYVGPGRATLPAAARRAAEARPATAARCSSCCPMAASRRSRRRCGLPPPPLCPAPPAASRRGRRGAARRGQTSSRSTWAAPRPTSR